MDCSTLRHKKIRFIQPSVTQDILEGAFGPGEFEDLDISSIEVLFEQETYLLKLRKDSQAFHKSVVMRRTNMNLIEYVSDIPLAEVFVIQAHPVQDGFSLQFQYDGRIYIGSFESCMHYDETVESQSTSLVIAEPEVKLPVGSKDIFKHLRERPEANTTDSITSSLVLTSEQEYNYIFFLLTYLQENEFLKADQQGEIRCWSITDKGQQL